MWQLYPTGATAKVTPDQGPQASRCDIPLGTMITDGIRKFRWGHIAASSYHPGKVAVASTTSKELGTGYFASAARVDGTRTMGKVGDIEVTLFSCLLLSANRYVDGALTIVSGTGKGHAYGIDSYEACAASKRQRVRLKTPLAAALGTTTQAVLVPNPYYGCKLPATSCRVGTGTVQPMGALTGSDGAVSDTSSYQWLQTAGAGIGYASTVMTIGRFQTLANSGRLILALSTTSLAQAMHIVVARSLQTRAAGETYCACEWLIEK